MEETKKCPYCGEEILAVAKKCKHCGEWLDENSPNEDSSDCKTPIKEDSARDICDKPKRDIPWKTIFKVAGVIIVAALVFLVKNARNVGKVARFTSNEIHKNNKTIEGPNIIGMWSYESTYETDDFDSDDCVTKMTVKINGIDDFSEEDNQEIDQFDIKLIFEIEDGDYNNVFTFLYHCDYIGKWRKDDFNVIIQDGESCDITYLKTSRKYERNDDLDYLNAVRKYIDEELTPAWKEGMLEEHQLRITKYSSTELTVVDEDGDEYIYKRRI